jgi:EF-P beta-lysylation protein EpmB
MIPQSVASPPQPVNGHAAPPPAAAWQRELSAAIRTPQALCAAVGIDPSHATAAGAGSATFPLLVPRGFVARMRQGDPQDPLLLQVLPRTAEQDDVPGFTSDPVAERAARIAPGLVRKYAGRALVLVTGGCAVHCRYCFRREFPYAESGASRTGVAAAIEAVATDASLHEVILSGGDPLLVDDDRLTEIVRQLEAIPHVRRLRIHTRLPIVLPERITPELVDLLAGTRLAGTMVVHANHVAELDESVAAVIRRVRAAGMILLNQAVLLAGVNDSEEALRELSERLVDLGVVPYYLHLLDRVHGAAHFEVSEARARELHRRLRETLPGYAVPRLAREVPGEPAKVWLA